MARPRKSQDDAKNALLTYRCNRRQYNRVHAAARAEGSNATSWSLTHLLRLASEVEKSNPEEFARALRLVAQESSSAGADTKKPSKSSATKKSTRSRSAKA